MWLQDNVIDSSENWMNAVDRGGLVHINHRCFTTFQPELSSAEENALRYAAGYVMHSIKEKLKREKIPMRDAML